MAGALISHKCGEHGGMCVLSGYIVTIEGSLHTIDVTMIAGAVPYPGIRNEDLLSMLTVGYRMEKPDNCSPQM